MSALIPHLLRALDVIYGEPTEPRKVESVACPCGSGVIEDDCTCQDCGPEPEGCPDCEDDVCEVCEPEDSAEVRYADSLDAEYFR